MHIDVTKPEMVADFVDQHMTHDSRQGLAGFKPILKDGPAIEKYHVHIRRRGGNAFTIKRHTLIKAQQVKRAFQPHIGKDFRVGEIADANDDTLQMAPKFIGNNR